MPRRLTLAAALILACAGSPASAGATDQPPLASTGAIGPIAAQSGWLAWSAREGDGWRLQLAHDGRISEPPVGLRERAFDVDLGTDASGRVVAAYSRCSVTPSSSPFGYPQPWTGAGCRVRLLDLVSGHERSAGIPRPRGSSDTTPSIWRGRIAFGRIATHAPQRSRLLLWSPRTQRLRELPGGLVPRLCPYTGGCRGATRRGAIQGVDLGNRALAFLWWLEAPAAFGHGGWEVRADPLTGGPSVLAGSGFVGEACRASTDRIVPSVPVLSDASVWFSTHQASCNTPSASVVRFDLRSGRARGGPLPERTVQLARSGLSLYAVVAGPPRGAVAPGCSASIPCSIQQLATPALSPIFAPPHSPFFGDTLG